ncbi:MAG: hypothetical protein KF900_05460 [Bacteroidetes bacterium]|nr:hypothetical protein [Bacteroidota bacterium]
MKKFLFLFTLLVFSSTILKAQADDDDRDWRFGLRITPQPAWFVGGDKNNIPKGTLFAYGFGLNIERRFSNVISLITGIGADFEGGKYSVKNDSADNYQVHYYRNQSNELVKPEDGKKNGDLLCHLNERKINTTMVSIPVILRLSTKEINGMRYYGLFGAEVGVRIKTTATDTYYETGKYINDSTYQKVSGDISETGVNINPDASFIPLRLGFNAGAGLEYRLSGSTAAFLNINFFRGLTPLMRNESKYLYSHSAVNSDGSITYSYIKQKLFQTAIRISVGIMF